mgnify:CR=1 FL=1
MTILEGDIKLLASRVMDDVPEGGGGPTGTVIPYGGSNAVFGDVTEAARVMIPASLPGRALRLNISLDEGLVGEIDRAAAAHGMSRSAFLADAARKVLDAA